MELLVKHRAIAVAATLLLSVVLCTPSADRYGDRLQIALPLAALGCKVATGGAADYFLRFLGMNVVLHSSKYSLGDHPLNVRPNGGLKGFPSGHTAAATFGASSLIHDCLASSPVIKTGIVLAAAFVGTSRVETDSHSIWQVLAGALLAVFFDRGIRILGIGGNLLRLSKRRRERS